MTFRHSRLFALLNPALNSFSRICYLVINELLANLAVNLCKADSSGELLTELEMGISNGRETLLVLPRQVRDISHGDGQYGPAGTNTESERDGRAEENVSVSGDDASGHGGDKDVDGAGHELLAALARWSQRGNGAGEGLLKVEGGIHGLVDLVLGGDSETIQGETSLPNLDG